MVATEPAEAEALSEEVLIHVTSFFRDPDVFAALERDVFPRLLASHRARQGEAIRVWVAGCSSGEEVYSLAICLADFLEAAGSPQIQVRLFGTDVSPRAIERARAGVYSETVAGDVTPQRLARFFQKTERGYEILKEVRDRCVFATHDIARDPPFSRMDIISCRNLMIYLAPSLQQRILPMFHYAMNEPGYLVLGTAETVGPFVGFAVVDVKNKIFARAPGPVRLPFDFGEVRGWSPSHASARPIDRATTVGDVRTDADRAVLATVAPKRIVVTDELAIVEFRGDVARYLEPIPGVATLDLLRMAREELRLALRRGIDAARTTAKATRVTDLLIGAGALRGVVDLDIIPFRVAPAGARFFAVLFSERSPSASDVGALPRTPERGAVEDSLRHELAGAREYLQSVIEQLEGGNEELKAANEEIVSSNEELQSTNEELQTAKEELQATNEELRTVNDEMLDRNIEATRLSDDLSNVLSSVAIPIVILGPESKIRRFTPAATKLLNLIPSDIGRPITDIQAKVRIPELPALIAEVLEHLAPIERTVQGEDLRWHQVGIRPYRTMDNRIDGVVLSVYDVDALKKAELLLAEARDYAESIVHTMRECLVVLDADLRVRTANAAFCQEFETTPEQIDGQRFDAICEGQWDVPEVARMLAGLSRGEPTQEVRVERQRGSGGARAIAMNGRRMSKTGWILLTLADITDRVLFDRARTDDRLARNEAGFRKMLTSAAEAIVMSDTEGRLVFANDTAAHIFGYEGDEMLGLHVDDLLPRRFREDHARLRAEYVAAPTPRRMARDRDLVAVRKDGSEFPVEVALSPMEGRQGALVAAFIADVTVRREAERKIHEYQVKLQQMAFEAALAEERERRRIAQDLHDRVGQSLALARIKLDVVRKTTAKQARAGIEEAIELISSSIDDTRTLTFDLSPPVLYDLGLKPALAWLCEDIEKRTGVHVEIADDETKPRFDEPTAALLFRAVRELLTNVFKHAKAPSARVALEQVGEQFEIHVEDTGAGFDVEALGRGPDAGFGLFSVREQIARLGGTVEIESTPRRGTRVSLRVPLAKPNQADAAAAPASEPGSNGA
jgi:PAS domain S-box-containing protein